MTKPLKILLVGDQGTGKTNLLSRFINNQFNPNYESTNGINIDHTVLVGDQKVEMDLLDLAGDKKWRCLADGLFRDADGILLVYDISNPVTFDHLTAWLRLIRETASPKTVIKLVGNKSDLQSRVPNIQAYQFATDNGLSYIETSASNGSNVALVFESIAQEIEVAMHLVSEPSNASSGHDNDKPFQVVLIDIEQAASHENIVCVEKPLEEADLEFIAISYRWGEVQEQVIDTKLGYMASITSFHLDDLYQLCRDIMHESDLQAIKYVWVDAICVDQNNQVRRKATIYQMSNIYHRAAYILAVPDLHLEYLRTNGILDSESWQNASQSNEFNYHLLHGNFDQLIQVTGKWFDKMGVPKDKISREKLTGKFPERFTDYLQVYDLQDADDPCPILCEHNCFHSDARNCHKTPNALLNYIQYAIGECHGHHEIGNIMHKNIYCRLCFLQMDMCKHQKSLDKNELIPESDQQWLVCVLRELCYDKYRTLVTEQCKAVTKRMEYLAKLIKDWSSRVWVISEYNIAKTKQSRKMKFWFLSLRIDPDDEKLDFFAFDFDKTREVYLRWLEGDGIDRVTTAAYFGYRVFQKTMMSQLNNQSFLEMMLNSKASRNEDRFYAIFPSTQYKDKLTSREVVSSWQIDNIVSVKLKLYELMTTRDKLRLLYQTAKNVSTSTCTFPAFANVNVDTWDVPPVKGATINSIQCNFNLKNNAALRLVPPDMSLENKNGNHYYKLKLSPKLYYVIRLDGTHYVQRTFNHIFNTAKSLWEILGINDLDDEMVFVYIPMYYMSSIARKQLNNNIEHITLFGSFEKSKWLLCGDEFSYHDEQGYVNEFPWKGYGDYRKDWITSFDIY